MVSFSGAGAVAGALFVAWLGNTPRKGWTALIMQVLLGVVTFGFAMSTHLWAGCFFVFLAGGAVLALFALLNALVQLLCPEEMRGRIMSVYHMAFRGAMPIGNLAAGSLANRFGAPLIVAVNAVVLMLVAAWYLMKDKQVVKL
jgi:MFS family permease